jgi:hypothetical protein
LLGLVRTAAKERTLAGYGAERYSLPVELGPNEKCCAKLEGWK